MEAFWARFFPISIQLRQNINYRSIGPVMLVMADLSVYLGPENSFTDRKHGTVNSNLAGGELLDLGFTA